jgi:hypothetical protein
MSAKSDNLNKSPFRKRAYLNLSEVLEFLFSCVGRKERLPGAHMGPSLSQAMEAVFLKQVFCSVERNF